MPSCNRLAACMIWCLSLIGCAGNDLLVKRQSEAEAKIEHLIQVDKKFELQVNELLSQIHAQEEQLKAASQQNKQLLESIRELRLTQEDSNAKITLLSRHVATPRIEVINPDPTTKSKDSGPPPEYVKAFGQYSSNNFLSAIEFFEAFLKKYPQSDYSANAIYWIGECFYSMSDLAGARASFQKVVDNYPKNSKAPDAMLKLGYTFAALKEKSKAVATFESLIQSYPGSPAAVKARERLTAQ